MSEKNNRDMIGYGYNDLKVVWPNNARLAVQIVLNYEEGAENFSFKFVSVNHVNDSLNFTSKVIKC